jgi:hypothetical protein
VQILLQLASQISAAAAEPLDSALAKRSEECEALLKQYFVPGPAPLMESGFVALSQGLPCLLSRCWVGLLQYPSEWARLHHNPHLLRTGVEELLRYAGLTQRLWRRATADVTLNGIQVRSGERLMLKIDAANRDPVQFTEANLINCFLARERHFTLGYGKHFCVAGPLIRLVLSTSTNLLLQRFRSASIVDQVQWRGGSGFRFPAAVNVRVDVGS